MLKSVRGEAICERLSDETLSDKVYNTVRDLILTNKLLPGQPLSIETLARDLGVSPTPVREALAKLSADGFIERARNKQARVPTISLDEVRQTYEVRKLLEPYAASLAAERVSTNFGAHDALRQLQHKAEKFGETVASKSHTPNRYNTSTEIDLRLQELICQALGNTYLRRILDIVANHSLRIRSFTEASCASSTRKVMHKINEEHLEIINALVNGDTNKVKEAVLRHLENAEIRTLNAIREGNGEGKEVRSQSDSF